MNIAGGTHSELETPAEIINHIDKVFSEPKGMPRHENAVRLICQSRGIMADSPVHEVLAVNLGDPDLPNLQTCLLVATENTAHDTPGCFFSLDNGDHWTPLGHNGPAEGGGFGGG